MISYDSLSNFDKHIHTEKRMGDRIKISYNDAISVFNTSISSNEKLAKAFENFKNLQNEPLSQINFCKEDILLYSSVDKFTKELYFIVLNGQQKTLLSLDILNIDTGEFTTIAEHEEHIDDSGYNHYRGDTDSPKISKFMFGSDLNATTIKDTITIKDTWNKAVLDLILHQFHQQNLNFPPNHYLSDDAYPNIRKTFISIQNGRNEGQESNFYDGKEECLYSFFNPGHTTLLPDDIPRPTGPKTKNSRSDI